MAFDYKVIAQSNPSATTQTTLYTVPSSTSTIISSLVVCNRSNVQQSFRVRINLAGAGDDNKQFLYYDVPIPANDTFVATIGITLATTDVVKVYASAQQLAFTLVGTEIT